MNEEKISVIVPAHNVEKYLETCLDSILTQDYKNLEVILVENASSDRTGEICDKYAEMDNRVSVIHEQRGGAALARNIGLDRATGKYISFIDSDDYVHPSFLKRLYDALKENGADIAECSYLTVNEDDKDKFFEIIDKARGECLENCREYDSEKAVSLVYDANVYEYVYQILVWNKLYRREMWEDIRFPEGFWIEDDYTTYKVLYKANKIIDTREVLYGYVQSNNSMMRKDFKEKRIHDSLAAYEEAFRFFGEKNDFEMQGMAKRRYLELCIELSYKVLESDLINRIDCAQKLEKIFIEQYKQFIGLIKESKSDENQIKIIQTLDNAYDAVTKKGIGINRYYNDLSKIYY